MATYRNQLWELATGQYGYVTTTDAAELGVPDVELRKIAARGRIRRVGHGLYRFDDLPPTRTDQFYEAVARVGPDAHLTGDAVLAFHELALVNPRRIRVGTGRRVQRQLPEWIEVIRENVPAAALTAYELVASTTVAYALEQCLPILMEERLVDAVNKAERDGLITRREAARLRTARKPMSVKGYDTPPKHVNALNTRLSNITKTSGGNELRVRRALANAIVAQMLPPGVVKGGTAMKLRVGEPASRFTPDLDAARAANVTVEDYIDDLGRRGGLRARRRRPGRAAAAGCCRLGE